MTHVKCSSSADTGAESLDVCGYPQLVSVLTVTVILSLQVRTPGLALGDALVPSHLSAPACLLLSEVIIHPSHLHPLVLKSPSFAGGILLPRAVWARRSHLQLQNSKMRPSEFAPGQ